MDHTWDRALDHAAGRPGAGNCSATTRPSVSLSQYGSGQGPAPLLLLLTAAHMSPVGSVRGPARCAVVRPQFVGHQGQPRPRARGRRSMHGFAAPHPPDACPRTTQNAGAMSRDAESQGPWLGTLTHAAVGIHLTRRAGRRVPQTEGTTGRPMTPRCARHLNSLHAASTAPFGRGSILRFAPVTECDPRRPAATRGSAAPPQLIIDALLRGKHFPLLGFSAGKMATYPRRCRRVAS